VISPKENGLAGNKLEVRPDGSFAMASSSGSPQEADGNLANEAAALNLLRGWSVEAKNTKDGYFGQQGSSRIAWSKFTSAMEGQDKEELNSVLQALDAELVEARTGPKVHDKTICLCCMALTHLALGDNVNAAARLQEAADTWLSTPGPPPELLFKTMLVLFMERCDYKEAAVVAMRIHQQYPQNQKFAESMLMLCLRLRPCLEAEMASLPADFFSKPIFPLKTSSELEDASYVRKNRKCEDKAILIQRASKCLETPEGESLAVQCLQQAARLKDVKAKEADTYLYCSNVLLLAAGSLVDDEVMKCMRELVERNPRTPEVHLGLAQAFIKRDQLEQAEDTLRKGLDVMSDSSQCECFEWPTSLRARFSESDPQVAEVLFRQELSQVTSRRAPVATCKLEECMDETRNISSGAAYVSVHCEDKCSVTYHPDCWRKAKEERGKTTANCFTPDCEFEITEVYLWKDGKARKDNRDSIFNLKNSKKAKHKEVKVEANAEVKEESKKEKRETGAVPKKKTPVRDTSVESEMVKAKVKTHSPTAASGGVIGAVVNSNFGEKKAHLRRLRSLLDHDLAKWGGLDKTFVASNALHTYFASVSTLKGPGHLLRLDESLLRSGEAPLKHGEVRWGAIECCLNEKISL